MSLWSQSLPSFKEGVGNKFLTPSISHRLLFPITAIIKSERSQYFFFRNRFVLYIVFMRIKTPVKRHSLNAFQSEALFFSFVQMKYDLAMYSCSVRKDYGHFYNSCKRWRIGPRVSITTELQRGSRE